jgi:hypothetical protein
MKKILVIGLLVVLVLSILSVVTVGFEKKFAREGGGSSSGPEMPPIPEDKDYRCPCGEKPIYFLKPGAAPNPPGTYDVYCRCTDLWAFCWCRARVCLPCPYPY